jgi:prevent-host-death family protein
VDLHEARASLSRLVDEVANGAEVVIAKGGKPIAKLVPFPKAARIRKPGLLKGKIRIAGDFDAPLPKDLLHAFEGRKRGT